MFNARRVRNITDTHHEYGGVARKYFGEGLANVGESKQRRGKQDVDDVDGVENLVGTVVSGD